MANQEQAFAKLTQHIEKEKQKVAKVFSEIEELFLKQLNAEKQRLLLALDQQVVAFIQNFEDYRAKINKYFLNESRERRSQEPSEDIEELITQCKDSFELEILVKKLLIEREEAISLKKDEGDEIALLQKLKGIQQSLQDTCNMFPILANKDKTEINPETLVNSLIDLVKK